MPSEEKLNELRKLLDTLRNPVRLRMAVTGLVLAVAYFAIYEPLSGKIDVATRRVKQEQQREELSKDVEFLRAQAPMFDPRLQADSDSQEWLQYTLDGIRGLPIQLVNFDSSGERRVGPFTALVFRIEVRGQAHGLDSLIDWLETNPRMFRIDTLKIEPARGQQDQRFLQMTLLGLKA
jgi:hypothetical protein